MQQLFRIVEDPRECSYLPLETAALEIRAVDGMNPAEYGDLLARGYRRFGWQVFRPACPRCVKCRSLRVLLSQFTPTAGERRVLRRNGKVRAELHPLFASREHIELYNLYHRFMREHRGWPPQRATLASYHDEFLSGSMNLGRQWLYFEEDRLIGVSLMDEAPAAISLVYFFHHPSWRARSPGTYSILNQLLYAKAMNAQYAYLGYWIESCRSMSYKARFRPHQILMEYPADGAPAEWK